MTTSSRSPSRYNPIQAFGSRCQFYVRSDLGVTLSSSNTVSTWSDQSSKANHLVQATGANRPAYVSSAAGISQGIPSVNGTAGAITTNVKCAAASVTTTGAACALFCVCYFSDMSVQRRPLTINMGAFVYMTFAARAAQGKFDIVTEAATNTATSTSMSLNRPILLGCVYDGAGNLDAYVNGVKVKTFTSVVLTTVADNIILCGGDVSMAGGVYEAMYLTGVPTADEVTAYSSYCRNRYGL